LILLLSFIVAWLRCASRGVRASDDGILFSDRRLFLAGLNASAAGRTARDCGVLRRAEDQGRAAGVELDALLATAAQRARRTGSAS